MFVKLIYIYCSAQIRLLVSWNRSCRNKYVSLFSLLHNKEEERNEETKRVTTCDVSCDVEIRSRLPLLEKRPIIDLFYLFMFASLKNVSID